MVNWKDTLIRRTTSIKEALQIIDRVGIQASFVVDEDGTLLGMVSDGDIRRGLLRGVSLDAPVSQVWNNSPMTATETTSRSWILEVMRKNMIRQIPIVDANRRLVRIEILDDFLSPRAKENSVLLMAGGKGRRLMPFTKDTPKPLLKLADKPILEHILESLRKWGFQRFHIAVKHQADQIEKHFGDGSKWNVDINYVREEQELGTAGAMSLLSQQSHPFLVMNADLLTNVNFDHLLQFHHDKACAATMCVRSYTYQVPFGVVSVKDNEITQVDEITQIEEKPSQTYIISGGIYAFEPDVLSFLQKDQPLEMPAFFNRLIAKKLKIAAFPVREYWLDIGRTDDFTKAMDEVNSVFKPWED